MQRKQPTARLWPAVAWRPLNVQPAPLRPGAPHRERPGRRLPAPNACLCARALRLCARPRTRTSCLSRAVAARAQPRGVGSPQARRRPLAAGQVPRRGLSRRGSFAGAPPHLLLYHCSLETSCTCRPLSLTMPPLAWRCHAILSGAQSRQLQHLLLGTEESTWLMAS